MSPALPPSIGIPLTAIALGWTAWTSWRGSSGLPPRLRALLLTLRLGAVTAILTLLWNPGKWTTPQESRQNPWLVLTDISESMAQPTANGRTRAEIAASLATTARNHASTQQIPLAVHPFAATLAPPTQDTPPPPTGQASALLTATTQALQNAGATGEPLAGIVILTDGRQTARHPPSDFDALGLRARSQRTAIHTVAIGTDTTPPDLTLRQPRAALTAFAGQSLRIPFTLTSSGIPPCRPTVTLQDAAGKPIAETTVDLASDATATGLIETAAPADSCQWTLTTPTLPGEVRTANNQAPLTLRVLHSKTRVFLAEGAPYWDSKFLAQLLRQQSHVEIQSIHRLSDHRYFRIDSAANSETDRPAFPDDAASLATFDLVVFGKNIDPFLTEERLALLRSYVRDRGGAVLFSRGRPTSSSLPGLEPLEPVTWGPTLSADYRFTPHRDGEAAGLFGQALPAADASLWTSLPTLKDGRQITLVKPFTRVLAEGIPDATGPSGRFPALVIRRYGQGVTGLVNGDGLWKWDFFPEARELGNCYEDFWTQLIQWMASYSEFLPGQDFSLKLPAIRGEVDVPLAAAISYRGPQPTPTPTLRITNPQGTQALTQPAPIPDPSGRPLWRASLTPDQPGTWTLKVLDPRTNASPTPEVLFTVPPPPTEQDDLSPDPQALEQVARATGGTTMLPADFTRFLTTTVQPAPPATRESGAVWQAAWTNAPTALAIALLLAAEWFLRRRNGLA